MKNHCYLLLPLCVLLLSTTGFAQDLDHTKTEPHAPQEEAVAAKVAGEETVSAGHAATDLTAEVKELRAAVEGIRRRQADQGADISDIRDRLKALTGQLELLIKSTSKVENGLERPHARISGIEKAFDTGEDKMRPPLPENGDRGKPDTADEVSTGEIVPHTSDPQPENRASGGMSPEGAYETALRFYKGEQYEKARDAFRNYLDQYPDAEQAANAHYWIGECFYFEGNCEQAILAYEQVIKNFPEGGKVPQALLKEGICFLRLGDSATAKLLFMQIMQHYPATGPATIAQAKLTEMK